MKALLRISKKDTLIWWMDSIETVNGCTSSSIDVFRVRHESSYLSMTLRTSLSCCWLLDRNQNLNCPSTGLVLRAALIAVLGELETGNK